MSGPLAGLRVLDLTRVLAGPFATAILADLGAEVVKLEPPTGDDYRAIGPFRDGESALFALTNRGKRSVVVDLKAPEGQALARRMAAGCDVVVENFRPGVAARLGLGAEALRAENPGLVVCSISGFGQSGPSAELPAYDIVVQAMSGWMDATGEAGGQPLKVGEALGDIAAGLYAVIAILSAVIFNALVIVALIPLALKGVRYTPAGASALLRRNLLIYGVGGVVTPFVGIWLIDVVVRASGPLRRVGVNPERVGLMLQLAIRAVPQVIDLGRRVREAQHARGLAASPRAFAVPLIVGALRRADAMGDALAARGLDD